MLNPHLLGMQELIALVFMDLTDLMLICDDLLSGQKAETFSQRLEAADSTAAFEPAVFPGV